VGREYEPTVGQWYDDLENDETFQVLRVDEDREIVEIQHLDGDIEDTEEPEGWSGSKSEKDEDEDEDEDWEEDEDDDEDDDDDDLDDEDDEEHDEY
jgi:hypothetical protein